MGADYGDQIEGEESFESEESAELESWRPSSAVTEELILSVADELEARARDASAVALSLRLAAHVAPNDKAGEDAEYDARVGELLLRAHTILSGEIELAPHAFPRPPRAPTNADAPPLSSDRPGRRTLPFGPESAPPPSGVTSSAGLLPPSVPAAPSSGPPPNTSGVRVVKGFGAVPSGPRTPVQKPVPRAANERTPKGFATDALNQWYEGLTKLTRE